MSSVHIGTQIEELAACYLQQNNLIVLHRNFCCKLGEIDLILRDQDCLVFAEVRYRATNKFGTAAESVTLTKQKKIIRTAQVFIQSHVWAQNLEYRFDVLAVSGIMSFPKIDWIKDAFDA